MERSFIAGTALASALVFAGVWVMAAPAPASVEASSEAVTADPVEIAAPVIDHEPTSSGLPESPPARDTAPYNVVRSAYGSAPPASRSATGSESSVFYSGCRQVRAAGAAPLYRGQPGYRPGMDGDNDGIACEPYR
ncbi:excalibur calcium-binding domain-containing protein [Sphingomonas sp. 4RDLI-65]|uniref:excalibur calcium-binding domain-containing protein n=1 Tax=Sphingomonas sp. 4RDLI-65 TaxID=3111641 RepID=UPI003C22073B